MDDTLLVGGLERLGDLKPEVDRLALAEWPAGDLLRQGRARHVFHDQEIGAVLGIEVEHGGDPGMAQARERERLVAEARPGRGVGERAFGQELERHLALEPLVARAVDHAHAARGDGAQDAVMRKGPADHDGT